MTTEMRLRMKYPADKDRQQVFSMAYDRTFDKNEAVDVRRYNESGCSVLCLRVGQAIMCQRYSGVSRDGALSYNICLPITDDDRLRSRKKQFFLPMK